MPRAPRHRIELHIDWTRCDGRGLCAELVPDILGRDVWGYPVARADDASRRSDPPVPRQLLEAAGDAVVMCPLQALRLIRREVAG